MVGRCVHNTGASLGQPQRGHFYSDTTVFDLRVGSDYPVLGIGIFETILVALVVDDTRKPNWLPAGLFEFEPQTLPTDWEFVLLDGVAASGGEASNGWVAKWGYPDLVRDESHSDALIERDPAALEVFFREFAKRPDSQTPPQT
jgi:hypothetical protein